MDINRLIDGFLGQGAGQNLGQAIGGATGQATTMVKSASQSMPGGMVGGAAAGGVVAMLLGTKKGRKMGKKAAKYGGMAALGGLAYLAYKNYQSGKQATPAAPMDSPPPPAPADSGFDPALIQDNRGQDMRLALVQAMISAAKADGHIDTDENQAIMDNINKLDFGQAEKGFLFEQLGAPSDPIAIASLAKDEAQGSELYLASLLAIDVDTPEEARYMERLGDALRLPEGLRQQLAAQVV